MTEQELKAHPAFKYGGRVSGCHEVVGLLVQHTTSWLTPRQISKLLQRTEGYSGVNLRVLWAARLIDRSQSNGKSTSYKLTEGWQDMLVDLSK